MPEYVDRLAGGLLGVADEFEREFEARLAESSTLAFRVAFGVLRHRQDAEDVAQEAFVNIDCIGNMLTEGRYSLSINIEDSSVYPNAQGTVVPNSVSLPPDVGKAITFRHFSASENVILRDGQSSEFTVATDKFTGEVVKADVTLTVVK